MIKQFILDSTIGGLIWILIGILAIKWTLGWDKEKIDWSSPNQGYLKGFIGGGMAIILGIVIIWQKLF
jgi:uncharacterized membrane protein